MKNIIGYMAGTALCGALLAGCNASEDYEGRDASPAQNPDCMQVYFPAPAANTLDFEQDDPTEFTVTVARAKTASAATVPIVVRTNTANVFELPASVGFAAGQESADITVKFPTAKLSTKYRLELAVEDPAYYDPYYVGTPDVAFTVSRLSWEPFATGNYYSELMQQTWEQVLHKAVGMDKYRFFDLYENGYNYDFEWDGASASLTPGGVPMVFPDLASYALYVQSSGLVDGENGVVFWATDPDPEYTFYDAKEKTFTFESSFMNFPGDVAGDTPSNIYGWGDDTYEITSLSGGE